MQALSPPWGPRTAQPQVRKEGSEGLGSPEGPQWGSRLISSSCAGRGWGEGWGASRNQHYLIFPVLGILFFQINTRCGVGGGRPPVRGQWSCTAVAGQATSPEACSVDRRVWPQTGSSLLETFSSLSRLFVSVCFSGLRFPSRAFGEARTDLGLQPPCLPPALLQGSRHSGEGAWPRVHRPSGALSPGSRLGDPLWPGPLGAWVPHTLPAGAPDCGLLKWRL